MTNQQPVLIDQRNDVRDRRHCHKIQQFLEVYPLNLPRLEKRMGKFENHPCRAELPIGIPELRIDDSHGRGPPTRT